jgi:dipeptidyl aminopeptidase/acylaminoacyl peptidase
MRRLLLLSALSLAMSTSALAQTQAAVKSGYQQPPPPIAQILDSKPTPVPLIDPTRSRMALLERANLPAIAELAEPDLKLAGYRINPRNNGQANSRVQWLTGLSLQDVAGGAARNVPLATGTRFTSPAWSPDGQRLAFLVDKPTGLELWIAEVATGRARRLTTPIVNAAATGSAFTWMPDSRSILVRAVPAGRGPAPSAQATPAPIVQVNEGRTAPVRTYQDLLRNGGDERLFDHYFTVQPLLVSIADGATRKVAQPGVYLGVSPSPDGRYLLLTRVKKPYSYNVPAALFPTEIVIADLAGRTVKQLANLPLRDDVPPQFDAVAPGPRAAQWRADKPATVAWVEAQDGGNARRKVEVRDRLLELAAPFTAEPRTLADMKDRYAGVVWGRDDTAFLATQWWNDRRETRILLNPAAGTARVLLSRNFQDRYNDPGEPVTTVNAAGRPVLLFGADGRSIFHSGAGARREGEFPFLDQVNLADGKAARLWQSAAPYYEDVVAVLDSDGKRLVTRRESRTAPPNLFVRTIGASEPRQLTSFPDPAPQLAGVTQQLITYKRKDGIDLSGTLYLPAGYDKSRDGPLPLVMWAYPTEFTDPRVAGQVVDTDNRFTRPAGISHLFLLTQGYAVLDNPTMPIVGADGKEANDTYIEQLSASAEAAVDAVVNLGVASRDRIAVGGHSYGAFMTANLLAHTDLFRTGIARSGAYNRTLTPFGFQAEQRTYWEAVDTYTKMSPFTYAPRIKEPILLIHGEADDNSGTFPVQSERFYAALKGAGANVRYVVLPYEAHGYRARESVGHTLWEMTSWLDRHLKPAKK